MANELPDQKTISVAQALSRLGTAGRMGDGTGDVLIDVTKTDGDRVLRLTPKGEELIAEIRAVLSQPTLSSGISVRARQTGLPDASM